MSGKLERLLLVGLLVFAWCGMCLSQEPLKGEARLRALEVAKKDAQRQLLEQVKGLLLTGETAVQDFVLDYDLVDAQTAGFIRGCRVVSERDLGDGSVEVVVEVTVATVNANIQEVMKGVIKDDKFKGVAIEKIAVQTDKHILSATGKGTGEEPVAPGGRGSVGVTPRRLPPFWQKVSPQQRLSAERAAKVIAYRNLLERIKGLYITSETRVNDFVLESDRIEASLRAFLQGAQQVGSARFLEDGTVEVKVQVPVDTLEAKLKRILKGVFEGDKFKGVDFEQIHIRTKRKYVEEIGRATIDDSGVIKEVDIDIEIETSTPIEKEKSDEGEVTIETTTVVE